MVFFKGKSRELAVIARVGWEWKLEFIFMVCEDEQFGE